jgi:hypothetical protein
MLAMKSRICSALVAAIMGLVLFSSSLRAEIKSYVISKPLKGTQIFYAESDSLTAPKKTLSSAKKVETEISSTPMVLTYDTESKSATIKYSGGNDEVVCLPSETAMTFILHSDSTGIFGPVFVNHTYVVHLNTKKDGKYLVTMTQQKNVPLATSVGVFEGWAE